MKQLGEQERAKKWLDIVGREEQIAAINQEHEYRWRRAILEDMLSLSIFDDSMPTIDRVPKVEWS